MTLINLGTTTTPVTYTVAELRALRVAVRGWLDVNEQTIDPRIVELHVQSHMKAGHKADDI